MVRTLLPAALLIAFGSLIVATNAPMATFAVALLLVLAGLVYGLSLYRVTEHVIRSARAFTAEAGRLTADQLAAAGAERHAPLREIWRAYRASLIVDPRSGALAGRVPAEEFFHPQAVGRVVDLGVYPAVPGVLVGLGLYFTFLGLALALAATGSGLGAADPVVARAALERLFGVAAFKFTTSLVAMACSLLFTLAERRRSFEVQRALAELSGMLDRVFPPLSLEALFPVQQAAPALPAEQWGRAVGEAAAAAVAAQLAPLSAALREQGLAAAGAGGGPARVLEQELAHSLALARRQADAELAAFRMEAGQAFEGFFARQMEQHERGLARVEAAMAELHKFAGGIGLYSGERIGELQQLAASTAGQAAAIDASYKGLVEKINASMSANNQHMQRFLEQAEERQGQFFVAYDEAVAKLTGEILKAASYLAEAADRRFEGA